MYIIDLVFAPGLQLFSYDYKKVKWAGVFSGLFLAASQNKKITAIVIFCFLMGTETELRSELVDVVTREI